jgi:16S rRNA (guanine527-N7)-methyltransferase
LSKKGVRGGKRKMQLNYKFVLAEGAREMGFELTEEQVDAFTRYKDLLLSWNEKMNLTAIVEEQHVAVKHFLDSLALLGKLDVKVHRRMLDVGTGAGFPGIPLKVCCPWINVVLLDSLKKRVMFLEEVIRQLELTGIETVHGRAEEKGRDRDFKEGFDLVVARAVASMGVLSEYCLPFVKQDGVFVAFKGPEVAEELEASGRALEILGGSLEAVHQVKLPFAGGDRSLVIIRKTRPTPEKYPRKPGMPEKKPLR